MAKTYQRKRMIMTTIWKYTLDITDYQELDMPIGSEILSVAEQNGKLCLWAWVFPEKKLSKRYFFIAGTGNPMPLDPGRFIGTVVVNPYVWHVFEQA